MKAVTERENLKKALAQVKRNKRAPRIDGMTIEDLGPYVKKHWLTLRAQLIAGTYKPQPVRHRDTEGVGRHASAPLHPARRWCRCCRRTGTERFPRRASASGPDARRIRRWKQAQAYRVAHAAALDIDLEKFFDRVNPESLIGLVAKRVADKRLLKLTRGNLNAGVMEGGWSVRWKRACQVELLPV